MKQIKVNPSNEKYYSSEFIKGFNCGAQRQFEADMADRKTEPTISKMEQVDEPQTSCKTCRYGEVDEGYVRCAYYSKSTEPQTERIKTHDYCDICNHKGCGNCIANNLDDYCVPSGYEPTTQMKTQNSNLTFEKRCKGCRHYKLTCDLFSEVCKYEPTTEDCSTVDKDINVRSKDEPQTEKPNNCEHITEDGVTCAKYPACDDCLDNPLNKVKGSKRLLKGKEQTDCPWK